MTCQEARASLGDWPTICGTPGWADVVRHTWACPACRAELVAVVVVAERVRVAMEALGGPPEALRARVVGTQQPPQAQMTPRDRLERALPYLPPIVRVAVDPLALVARWLPVPDVP